jgi:uncharacterized membrane protein
MPVFSVEALVLFLAGLIEALAALIIALGAGQALLRTIKDLLRPNASVPQWDIRLRLGKWLALALEFLLGADILKTVVSPSWNEIGQLAAIATLRTLLNYFLEREIEREIKRETQRSPEDAAKV